MRRLIPGILISLAIALLGLGFSWLSDQDILPNPIFSASYEWDVAGLATRLGMLLGGLTLGFFLLRWAIWHGIEQEKTALRREQELDRQRFFQRLDHEMKNPLTIIRLGMVNLQQSGGLGPEQTGSLERISQQVRRLQKLVVDLRLLYDLDASIIERKPVRLRELLEEAIALSSDAAEISRRINLNVQQMPWPVSDVLGDRDLLVLVFRNLLDNALKFSAADGMVEVRVTEDGRTAIVEVVDTGAGIPPAELEHIFEELYRGENAHGIPGSGLGLKLVERIITLHNGAIRVRSKTERGSVFTIRLPLVPESA
jgi:two-component system OmpR family sensor kinase